MPTLSAAVIRKIVETVFSALGQVLLLAGAGVLLTRAGVITRDVRSALAKISAEVAVPCLLFDSMLRSASTDLVTKGGWFMLVLPCVYVPIGLLVGHGAVLLGNAPADFRNGMRAAVAFGNSTGLPIVLLSVIQSALIQVNNSVGPDGKPVPKIPDPVAYLALYLLCYPVLQWGVGGMLLRPVSAPEVLQKAAADCQEAAPATAIPCPPTDGDPLPIDRALSALTVRTAAVQDCQPIAESPVMNLYSQHLSAANGPESPVSPHDPCPGYRPPEKIPLHDDVETPAGTGVADTMLLLQTPPHPPTPTVDTVPLEPRRRRRCDCVVRVLRQFLVRPVVASLIGMCCGMLHPVRNQMVSADDTTKILPLGWFAEAMHRIGQAAVPINMLILGSNLSKGPDWKKLPVRAAVVGVVAKMIVMPLFGLLAASLYRRVFATAKDIQWPDRIFDSPSEIICLVVAVVVSTPTANNLAVMCELAGQSREAMATLIFAQYVSAPLLLTASVTWLLFYISTI